MMGRQQLLAAVGLAVVLLLMHAGTGAAARTLKPGYQTSKAPKTKPPTTSQMGALILLFGGGGVGGACV